MRAGRGFGVLHVSFERLSSLPHSPADLTVHLNEGARSYAKQTVYDAHLSSKKHKKAAEKLTDSTNAQPNGHATEGHEAAIKSGSPAPSALTAARQAKDRQTALLEHVIRRLASHPSSPLVTIRADTKSNVERKQTLTDRERQQEIEEMEERADREARQAAAIASAAEKGGAAGAGGVGEDEEDEEGRIYNPLKLPLGWDGKPIPYWLYKLHGLGVEYKCEICSNTTYMGRWVVSSAHTASRNIPDVPPFVRQEKL